MCWKISDSVDGGRAEGLACLDPGARTPIGDSGNLVYFSLSKIQVRIFSLILENDLLATPIFQEQFLSVYISNLALLVYETLTMLPSSSFLSKVSYNQTIT